MENPLKVSLENIIPLTEARDHFSQIVNEVQKDKLYVLTKGGKPAVAIVDVKYLEHITGGEVKKEHVQEEINKAPEKVGLPPMIEHPKTEPLPPPPPSSPPPAVLNQPPTPPPSPKPAGFAAPQQPSKPTTPPPAPTPVPPPPPKPASTEKIDIQFSQEPPPENKNQTPSNLTSPDDKTSPAQYDKSSEEPEDMSID